jgi:hypothetical protein
MLLVSARPYPCKRTQDQRDGKQRKVTTGFHRVAGCMQVATYDVGGSPGQKRGEQTRGYTMATFYVAAGSSNATEIGTCSACVVGHHNCRAQITDLIGPRCGHQSLGEGDHLWWRGRTPTTDGQQCRHVVPATQEIRTHHWAAVTQTQNKEWGAVARQAGSPNTPRARFNSGLGE